MTMDIIVASVRGGNELGTIKSWKETASKEPDIIIIENEGEGPVSSYQCGYENSEADIQGYLHDDLFIYEKDWDSRVLAEFEDPKVGVVGFGGGWGHGLGELYFNSYRIEQLQRLGYCSNTQDADRHGIRFDGSCEVAVLDGYALFVRREIIEKSIHFTPSESGKTLEGGWPVEDLVFHVYDYWVCAMAHRLQYTIRMVGIDCLHQGGQTSTQDLYLDYLRKQGLTDQDIHANAHVWFYNEFDDVLPWRVDENKRLPGWNN